MKRLALAAALALTTMPLSGLAGAAGSIGIDLPRLGFPHPASNGPASDGPATGRQVAYKQAARGCQSLATTCILTLN